MHIAIVRRQLIAALVCLAALCGWFSAAAQAQSVREGGGVFRVVSQARYAAPASGGQQSGGNIDTATGTGFLVSGRRIVVTNNHVVALFRENNGQRTQPEAVAHGIFVLRDGKPVLIRARPLATLPGKDLALLEASEDLPGSPVTLADYDPERDTEVEAIGYPGVADPAILANRRDSDDLPPALLLPIKTQGRLQRIFDVTGLAVGSTPARLSARVIQHSAPIAPGNSGGPLVNRCDQVVGINTFGSQAAAGIAQQSISAREVAQFLRAQNIRPVAATGFCTFPGGIASAVTSGGMLGVLALLIALSSLVLALRRPTVVREVVKSVSRAVASVSQVRGVPRAAAAPAPAAQPAKPEPLRAPEGGRNPGEPKIERGLDRVVHLVPTAGGSSIELPTRRLSNGRAVVVGRSRDALLEKKNDGDTPVVIDNESVSRRHARLTLADGRLRVEDLGSSGGTYRDGQRVATAGCANGALLRFGNAEYRVEIKS